MNIPIRVTVMKDFDLDDIPANNTETTPFHELVEAAQSRRGFLKAGLGLGVIGFFGLGLNSAFAKESLKPQHASLAEFNPKEIANFVGLEANTLDTVTVPEGYRYAVINRWGDKLHANSPEFIGDASDNAAAQLQQVGYNHDGIHFFPIDSKDSISGSSKEGLLVTNHEYVTPEFFYPKGVIPGGDDWTEDWVRKSQYAQGASVVHVRLNEQGLWEPVLDSKYNRNINATTLMELVGPAMGNSFVRTNKDKEGREVYGTFGNCGNGYTYWNTYLTCEENFTDYFGVGNRKADDVKYDDYLNDKQLAGLKRYKGSSKTSDENYVWDAFDERFDWTVEPNEVNRFGWVVEIDPFDPESKPKKLTALGRFKHENAAIALAPDNRVVVYMGDDQRSEYIYKFVSEGKFDPSNDAANRTLLHEGTLYVAVFSDNKATDGDFMGTGKWVPLVLDTPTVDGRRLGDLFADMGELLVYTRQAADAVGATPMDRPEWVAVHPHSKEVFVTLTNNSNRGSDKERFPDGPKHPGVFGPNPRNKNPYGQIVRWVESGSDATADTFEWDVFVLAGNPNIHDDIYAGSDTIDKRNTFNSPDGLAVDPRGLLWIQTDGNYSNAGQYEGQGNNSMLVADPKTKIIRRFMVGPKGCEVTGITWTPDMKYIFVNIQHPGEGQSLEEAQAKPLDVSTWPEGPEAKRPRPATVVIWREDGGVVGSFPA